jgi:uncharacterized membrane protein
VHVVLTADPRTIVLGSGVATLALVGTMMQDIKKKQQNPAYATHMARTSHVPFMAIITGRQPWRALWPGLVPVLGGAILWFIFVGWAHNYLIGVPAAGWSILQ